VTNAPIIFTKDTFYDRTNFCRDNGKPTTISSEPAGRARHTTRTESPRKLTGSGTREPAGSERAESSSSDSYAWISGDTLRSGRERCTEAAHEQAPQLGQHAAMLPPQGLPQALPVVPQGVTPFAGGLSHSSFSTYFYGETKDVLRQRYAAVLERFDPSSEASQGAEALLEAAIGNPNMPCTYLCVAALHGSGRYRVYILHTISKYTPSTDGLTTPWDNKLFAYLGDTFQGNALSVIIPPTVFNTVQCQIYNNETFTTELPNLNNGNLFPRLEAGHQDAMANLLYHQPA